MSRKRRNIRTFLRTDVEHFSFVTGLLCGGSVHVNVILGVSINELPAGVYWMMGDIGQCRDLLSFIGGTYDSMCLAAKKYPEGFVPPVEFETETWECPEDDDHKWQLKKRTCYKGVEWLTALHGNPEDSMCWGEITFLCENIEEKQVDDGEIILIPEEKRYPDSELRRILQKTLPDPKHPESYLG